MTKYSPLKSASSRLSDDYYRLVSQCLVTRNPTRQMRAQCIDAGLAYLKALNALIDCLSKMTSPPVIAHELEMAMDYRELLERDLNELTQPGRLLAGVSRGGVIQFPGRAAA